MSNAPQVYKARETFSADRLRRKASMPKPKSWSHDDELASMRGKMITVAGNDGGMITALLLEADKYALKLVFEDQSTLIVFKHTLESFTLAKE
jgi:hypothetical protein